MRPLARIRTSSGSRRKELSVFTSRCREGVLSSRKNGEVVIIYIINGKEMVLGKGFEPLKPYGKGS